MKLSERIRVVVLGGGPAGLASLLSLSQRCSKWELILVDPGPAHLIVPRLHETVRLPINDIQVEFESLAERYRFEWIAESVVLDQDTLTKMDQTRQVELSGRTLDFDFLIIATGSKGMRQPADAIGLEQLKSTGITANAPAVDIVGSGASAVQVAAELAEHCQVRLFGSSSRLLPALPEAFHNEAEQYLTQLGVHIELNTLVQTVGAVPMLWLTGTQSQPMALQANAYGQVLVDGIAQPRIYAAGDCVQFAGHGLNAKSAQAAVRKGLHVATNIRRQAEGRWLRNYIYIEAGYFVPLGKSQAIGWIGSPHRIVKGKAALAIHQLIDEQYGLLLRAINPYLF